MKALYSTASSVPLTRVIREHRTALVPLGIVLAINMVLLIAVVLPLSRRVAANERRAQDAAQQESSAAAEFRQAEALREGKSRATKDLDTFYRQVLPSDVAAARRMAQSKILRLADAHDVQYRRGATDTKVIRDSRLQQFTYELTLSGSYDDIRALLYELETSPDFVVIDNIVLAEGQDTNAPLSLALELSTYYREPAAVTAAPAPRGEGGAGSGQVQPNGR